MPVFTHTRVEPANAVKRGILFVLLIMIPLVGIFLFSVATYAATANMVLRSPVEGTALTSRRLPLRWTNVRANSYDVAVGSEQALPDYGWKEGLTKPRVLFKKMPVDGSKIYIRIFAHFDTHTDIYDTYVYALGKTTPEAQPTTLIQPTAESSVDGDAVELMWKNVSAQAYDVALGSTPGAPDIAWMEGLTKNAATVTDLPTDGSEIFVRIFSYFENGVVTQHDASFFAATVEEITPETEAPAPPTDPTFAFSPASGSTLSGASAYTITFPTTDIAYYAVGTFPAGPDVAYGESLTTDHISFDVSSVADGTTVYIKIVDTHGLDHLASYVLGETTQQNPSPEGPPASDGSFVFSPVAGSVIPQGTDVTITFPYTEVAYYGVGTALAGGDIGYGEALTTNQITFSTRLFTTGDTAYVKIASANGESYFAEYSIGDPVEPLPGYDPGYTLEIVDGQRVINGCKVFTKDSYWNERIDSMPVDELSGKIITRLDVYNPTLHADFGDRWLDAPNGIPINIVPEDQPLEKVTNITYAGESDIPMCPGESKQVAEGCYPIPQDLPRSPLLQTVDPSVPIEQITPENYDGDLHVIVLQEGSCNLYEFFKYFPVLENGSFTGQYQAFSPSIWNLNNNADRFVGQKDQNLTCNRTSADAAGMPIFPGLVLYEEVKAGEINHALRFTTSKTRRAFVYPATHYASWIDEDTFPLGGEIEYDEFAPLGARFRLRADYDISGFHPDVQVILKALKEYGMILADNGGPNFISGVPDPRWSDEILNQLKTVPITAFDVVEMGTIYEPETTNAFGNTMSSYNCAGIESNHVDSDTFRLPSWVQ